jgi:hypothetical protein
VQLHRTIKNAAKTGALVALAGGNLPRARNPKGQADKLKKRIATGALIYVKILRGAFR